MAYKSKDGKETRVFDALEWLAAMCFHVPNKGEQMVRYYGHYSNVSRGRRKKAQTDDQTPYILEPKLTDMAFRRNWSRLIQEIYEVDPLTCAKCQGQMRVITFIENKAIAKKILKHFGIWEVKRKPRPRANAPPLIPDSYPIPSADDYLIDPDRPAEVCFWHQARRKINGRLRLKYP